MSSEPDQYYLKEELYELIRKDSRIFDFIQSSSLDGIWYWDLENPAEEWMSERFWTTLGYDPAGMPHNPESWQDIINPEDLALALENFTEHCSDPNHPYDQVVRYRHKDNSTVWIRCRGLAIRDDAGKPLRMLGAHTDITLQKHTEQKLAERNAELVAANNDLTSFAYAAAHDIQAPVRNLKGLLDILQTESSSDADTESCELVDMAQEAAHRLQDLTAAILQFAHVGNTNIEHESISCQDLLEDIGKDLHNDFTCQGAIFSFGSMPDVFVVPTPTRQLFQNLISNALKFQPQDSNHKTTIAVASEPFENGWKFSVSDNGIGIDTDNQKKIFNAFNRLNLYSEFTGSGLGLALCKKAVTLHGGDIWVESELGKGATFHFTYPNCALKAA